MSKQTKTTTQEEAKPVIVPKLRFPEFREAEGWAAKPLARVCNVLQGYGFPNELQGNRKGKYPFCKVSDISRAVAENGGFLREAINYIDDDDLLKLRAKIIPEGSTVFAKIGEALRLNRRAYVQRECLIDNNATGLKSINGITEDYFIYLLSQLIDLNDYCGGAVPSVNKSTLEEIKVLIPSIHEQQRIAACLSSLDDLINAQSQQLDSLKTHKKGLMQQLFPREGESVPRLRFPEFRGAEGWMEQSIGDFGQVVTGSTPSTSQPNFYGGHIPFVSPADISDLRFVDQTKTTLTEEGFRETRPIRAGSILFVCIGSTIGKVAQNVYDSAMNQQINAIVPSSNYSDGFVYFALSLASERIAVLAGRQAVPIINKSLFSSVRILVPQLPEQQRISSCLSSLDDFITAKAQKLEVLKTHKKGLMQQLFPSMRDASL